MPGLGGGGGSVIHLSTIPHHSVVCERTDGVRELVVRYLTHLQHSLKHVGSGLIGADLDVPWVCQGGEGGGCLRSCHVCRLELDIQHDVLLVAFLHSWGDFQGVLINTHVHIARHKVEDAVLDPLTKFSYLVLVFANSSLVLS